MDDGRHHAPTRKNIMEAFDRITQYSKAGDVVFIHYSGHGGRVRDTTGDEADGYDEVSCPHNRYGFMRDDVLMQRSICPIRH